MRARFWIPFLLMGMAAFVLAGCGSSETGSDSQGEATQAEGTHGEATPSSDTPAAESAAPMSWNEAELAVLAFADQADGTADHVVSQCASCQLHMAGKAEHALQAGDYEMHFCSEKCKASFAEDMHASLQKLPMQAEGAAWDTGTR